MAKWIQAAVKKMEKKGTIGAFGKATASKISAGKKAGGLEKKRAVFAENMKRISASNRGTHYSETLENIPEHRRAHYQSGHAIKGRNTSLMGKLGMNNDERDIGD